MSVLDIWNDAASQISNETIGSLDEDSPIANACRDLWPSIRDHLLSLADWKFSERRAVLYSPRILVESIAAGHERTRIISLPAAFQESAYRFRIVFVYQDAEGGGTQSSISAPITTHVPPGDSLTAPAVYADINLPVALVSPEQLLATSLNQRILLTWEESAEATDYNYRWREEGLRDWTTETTTEGFPQVVILNLENGTGYEFQVMAKNPYGISRWTDITTGIPEEPAEGLGQAPPTPNGLKAVAGDMEVRLTWNPVSTATGYDYRFRSEGSWIEVVDEDIFGTAYIVTGIVFGHPTPLTNGIEYEFQIRARNEIGFSNWTASVTATPTSLAPAVPTGLEAFAGNATMLLTWNLVSGADDYDARYRLATANAWTEITDTEITDTSIVITGLTNDSEYQFSVRSRRSTNAEDLQDSNWSGHVTGTPSANAVPQVANLIASGINEAVSLAWSAVASAIDYDVRWRRTDMLVDWETDEVDVISTDTTRTVENLTNGITYEFQVRAERASDLGGAGPWSNSATATPRANPVGPATAPVLTATGSQTSRSILLEWTFGGEDHTGFEYRGRVASSLNFSGWQSVPGGDETTRQYRIYPSLYGTQYCYQVRAINDAGDGPESNTACAFTRAEPATPVSNPPGAVSLNIALASDGQVSLSWSGGSGATSFYYQQDSGSYLYAGSASSTSRTITGLTNGTRYCFRIQARNSDGSTTSNQLCATPQAPDPEPVEPVEGAPTTTYVLHVTHSIASNGNTLDELRWTHPFVLGDTTRFEIRDRRMSSQTWRAWQNLPGIPRPHYYGTELYWSRLHPDDDLYCYQLRAYNSVGTGPTSATVCGT